MLRLYVSIAYTFLIWLFLTTDKILKHWLLLFETEFSFFLGGGGVYLFICLFLVILGFELRVFALAR
jgi:hypothetical protein